MLHEGDGYPYDPMKKHKLHTMDLISDLPDPIIHHIMSFLTTSDLTKLSILSKRFFFLWASYPVIELDQTMFSRSYQGSRAFMTDRFLDHVLNSVLLRRSDILLSEFRVYANLEGLSADHRFNLAISYVLANGVRCMELDLGSGGYLLPNEFTSRSLNVLRVRGVQLNLCHLIHVCPSLTTLCLTSCVVLPYIDLSSQSLREIEIHSCGVKSIKINAPNLQSFLFRSSDEGNPKPCQIDVLQCQNIVSLSLNNLFNGLDWIEEHVYRLSKLKTFILNGCRCIKHIRIWNDKLERVEIRHCPLLTSIELKAPSLESFAYKGAYRAQECNITFLASKYVKDLSIMSSALITDQWVEAQLANMTRLESLRLKGGCSLRKIKVCHEKLQVLELGGCEGLVEAEIDTPRLVTFMYHGDIIELGKMVTHSNCTATLSMEPWVSYNNESFCRWRNLLSFFGHCKALKLICNTHKEVMIPELHRERLPSPLYDLQHLEIEIKSLKKIDKDLVDSLLWLSPLPKTLHISSGSCSRLQMIIEFVYDDIVEVEEDENPYCCETKPIKCWKHHLKRLDIQSSEVTLKKGLIELQNYFHTNAKKSESLCFRFGLT